MFRFFPARLILIALLHIAILAVVGCHRHHSNSDDLDTDSTADSDSIIDTGSSPDTETGTLSPDTSDTNDTLGDTESHTETVSSCLQMKDPSLSEADANELFNYEHVPVFDIFLPQEKWEALQNNAMDEEWEEAEVCFEGKGLGKTGLRFKGSYGTLYGCFDEETGELICPRLSMKLKFDKYVEGQYFYGLKRLNFNANRYDDSRMKERLAYDVYRSMGIVAPRASWAVVRVNGKSYGLYGMVEEIDGRFTADRWPDYPDGNVYKEVWPTDTDESDVIAGLKTNDELPDVSSFLTFSNAIASAADDAERLQVLGEYTDLAYWARYMAADEAVLSYDGVTYFFTDGNGFFHNHNYNFYEDSPLHFTLIPWDVESTFWINEEHAAPHWTALQDDCSATYPYWGGLAIAPACDPIFRAMNTDLVPWRQALQELLDGPFALDTMLENIDKYQTFIADEARAKETPTMYNSFDSAVEYLRDIIPELRARLEGFISAE